MRELIKKYPILATAVIVSLVSVMILLGIRIHTEVNNRDISVIMSYHHLETMANEAGVPLADYMDDFAEMGIAAVMLTPVDGVYDAEQAALVRDSGMELILAHARYIPVETYARYRQELDATYPLYIGRSLPVGDVEEDEGIVEYSETEEYFEEEGISIGLVEEKGQYGHTAIDQFKNNTKYGSMVRVFRLIPSFAQRYGVLGFEGAEEIENIFFRAVTDRNIRVLLLTPFLHNETHEMITDPAEYSQMLTNLSERIEGQRLYLGTTFSAIDFYRVPMVLIALLGIGVFALGIFLLLTMFNLPKGLRGFIFGIGVIFSVLGVIIRPFEAQTYLALGAAIIFPCLAIYLTVYYLRKQSPIDTFPRMVAVALVALGIAIGVSLIGGAYVGANLSNSKYMLEIATFRGVKLSQMLPLVYAAITIYQQLYHKKGVSLRRQYRNFRESANQKRKILYMVVFIVLIAAVGLFILRTGDRIIQAGAFEQRFRIFLETELLVRPRTKEFMVAWPALFVGAFCLGAKLKPFAWPFLFAATIGCASVVNTFCHIRAHYLLSLLRTAYGAGFGLVIGLIALILLWFIYYLYRKRKQLI